MRCFTFLKYAGSQRQFIADGLSQVFDLSPVNIDNIKRVNEFKADFERVKAMLVEAAELIRQTLQHDQHRQVNDIRVSDERITQRLAETEDAQKLKDEQQQLADAKKKLEDEQSKLLAATAAEKQKLSEGWSKLSVEQRQLGEEWQKLRNSQQQLGEEQRSLNDQRKQLTIDRKQLTNDKHEVNVEQGKVHDKELMLQKKEEALNVRDHEILMNMEHNKLSRSKQDQPTQPDNARRGGVRGGLMLLIACLSSPSGACRPFAWTCVDSVLDVIERSTLLVTLFFDRRTRTRKQRNLRMCTTPSTCVVPVPSA